MALAFKVDVTEIGMDEMREYPELGEWSDIIVRMIVDQV